MGIARGNVRSGLEIFCWKVTSKVKVLYSIWIDSLSMFLPYGDSKGECEGWVGNF